LKKVLLLLYSVAAVAGFASADTIDLPCQSWVSINPFQTGGLSCGAIAADPGKQFTQVQLFFTADYSSGSPTGTTISVVYDSFNSALGSWGPTSISISVSGTQTSSTNVPPYDASILGYNVLSGPIWSGVPATFFPGVTFNYTTALTAGGAPLTSSGQSFIRLTFFDIPPDDPPAGAPEPGTLGLMGGALVGLGLVASKFRK
jgi:hypothetical protein